MTKTESHRAVLFQKKNQLEKEIRELDLEYYQIMNHREHCTWSCIATAGVAVVIGIILGILSHSGNIFSFFLWIFLVIGMIACIVNIIRHIGYAFLYYSDDEQRWIHYEDIYALVLGELNKKRQTLRRLEDTMTREGYLTEASSEEILKSGVALGLGEVPQDDTKEYQSCEYMTEEVVLPEGVSQDEEQGYVISLEDALGSLREEEESTYES